MTLRRHIPEIVVPGMRLGRNVSHDPRSLAYRVQPAQVASVRWLRRTPILDQLNLGSCCGNAACGVLGTDPFYDTVWDRHPLDETEAVDLYSLATRLDEFDGTYPPTDSGSSGLGVAKACMQLGLISGYTHALSFGDFLAGMQTGPAITGITWLTGCDSPDETGLVRWSGTVRGGHEIEADQVDFNSERVWFDNSWGSSFGVAGRFAMSFEDYGKALADDGDATFFTPLIRPAPTPLPLSKTFTAQQGADIDAWAQSPHVWRRATAAAKAWKAGQ